MILTIGHSTRAIQEFILMLRAHNVEALVDVRTVPRSRRYPQFDGGALAAALAAAGIDYLHMPTLGGPRRPRKDSPNLAWRNGSFRGYADYMQTPEFAAALDRLIEFAGPRRTAVMCAEAVPWRCHRSLIADALAARGIAAEHIMSEAAARPHTVTSFARIEEGRVTYPPEQPGLDLG